MDGKIERILKSQEEDIRKDANLPFEQKIRILIRMQARAAAMRPDLNRAVWSMPDDESNSEGAISKPRNQ